MLANQTGTQGYSMVTQNQALQIHRQQLDRMLRRKEVEVITGLSRSSIYAGMADGTFPASIRLSRRAVAWSESSIRNWIAERTGGGKA